MDKYPVAKAAQSRVSTHVFYPAATLKCRSSRLFRSQVARDLGCLLDINPVVTSWTCMPPPLEVGEGSHRADFLVFYECGDTVLLDAPDRAEDVDPDVLTAAALKMDRKYRLVSADEMYKGPRLRNVKDLLRYADHTVPLGDRIRVLAALDEAGSLTLGECLQLFRESRPMPGLASLILREGMLEVDFDEGLIGPDTSVRRIRR